MKKKEKAFFKKPSLFAFAPIIPHLIIIAACIGLYYAMMQYYLFFPWGIYIYYGIQCIIALCILSASAQSVAVPLAALLISLLTLFTHNVYLNNLMNVNTAWELNILALVGIIIAVVVHNKKGRNLC